MITIIKWCGHLCEAIFVAVMLGSQPAHATSYEYAVNFELTDGYSVTGSVFTTCDQCLIGANDVSYWKFTLSGPNSSAYTIASLNMPDPGVILAGGQDPLYALPQGIFFDGLREYQGFVAFSDPGNPAAELIFNVFAPDNSSSDIDYLIDLSFGQGGVSSLSYSKFHNSFYPFGGYQIATLQGTIACTNFICRREARREEREIEATPLPAALPLFAIGLGAMGMFGWRRKRKTAAVAA
jgi:hypothetical protein